MKGFDSYSYIDERTSRRKQEVRGSARPSPLCEIQRWSLEFAHISDAADAEAIVTAARQPEMRFVEPKTVEQQSCAAVFRSRERLVQQRTGDVNALRALLYEHGHVFPAGIRHLDRMKAFVEDNASDLPALIWEECQDLLAQIAEKTARIAERASKLSALALQSDKARRLQTMPGVGPLTAVAVEAFGPDMSQFKTGRDFAAWLGLVPRQHSSGGKERLGRMTKAGQADIRRLLTIGAMSRLGWLGQRKRIEEAFGWAKTIGGAAQTAFRGIERARAHFIMTLAAGNLARLPKLLAA